jgi:nitrite reductase (NADH) large subunit
LSSGPAKATWRKTQYYRENAKYLERSYTFVERIGIEKLRAIVLGNSEGVAAQLDAAMQESIDVYVDPWKEAHAPVTPTQFASILPAQHER